MTGSSYNGSRTARAFMPAFSLLAEVSIALRTALNSSAISGGALPQALDVQRFAPDGLAQVGAEGAPTW